MKCLPSSIWGICLASPLRRRRIPSCRNFPPFSEIQFSVVLNFLNIIPPLALSNREAPWTDRTPVIQAGERPSRLLAPSTARDGGV
jgi:hypothetical protein